MRARSLVLPVALAAVLGLWFLVAHEVARDAPVPTGVASRPVEPAEVHLGPAAPASELPDPQRAPAPTPEALPTPGHAVGITVLVHDAGSGRGRAGVLVQFADVDLLPEMRSFDELVEHVGLSATTDASGRVRFPMPVGEFRIVARAADGYGQASRRDLDLAARTVRVALFPDPENEVRVREASGAPARDVRVGLVSRPEGRQGWLEEWDTSDAQGRVILHPARARREPLFAHALIESPEPVEVSLGEPNVPVTLVLPPCGRVDVLVADAHGRPEPRALAVVVPFVEDEDDPAAVDAGPAGMRWLSGGRAAIPRVVAGQAFRVRVGDAASEMLTLEPDEVRGLTLTHPIGSRVTARLLDPHGVPLAHALVRRFERVPGSPVSAHPGSAHPGETVRCDAEGRLGWNHREREEGTTREMTLATAGRLREPLAAKASYRVTVGTVDLGDLLLAPEPLLVGGIVIDETGAPVAEADVTCGLLPAAARDPIWRPDLTATTDEAGRFAIHATVSLVPDLSLAVDRPGHVPVRDLRVASGTERLRIVLSRGSTTGSVAGRILFENVLDLFEGVQVLARPLGGGTQYDGDLHPWSGADFEIPRLPPGTYEVEVRWNLGGVVRAIRSIQPVLVTGGAPTRDPRLDPIDLRETLRRVRLTVRGSDGEPVREVQLSFLDPTRAPGTAGFELGTIRRDAKDGSFSLLLPTDPLDLEVSAAGCLPERVVVTGDSLRVDLRAGPEVTLVPVAGDPIGRPEGELSVALQPLGSIGGFRAPGHRPWGPDGANGLRAGAPGRYRVDFDWTAPGAAGPRRFAGGILEVGSEPHQRFEVALPAALAGR